MPSFARYRSSSPTYSIPAPDALPSKTVGFVPGPTPVTSISRVLTNDELWTLYHFETHSRLCAACRDPYSVHRAGGRLCPQGHQLAKGVARLLWSEGDAREVFDATAQDGSRIRVEIPQDYEETRSLLRAMERSLRHRRKAPIVSFNKTYTARPQAPSPPKATTPERRYSVKEPTSSSPLRSNTQSSPSRSRSTREPEGSPSRYERRQPEIVDWPEVEYQIREPSQIIQPNRSEQVRTPEPMRPVQTAASPSKTGSLSKRNSVRPVPASRTTIVPVPETTSRPRSGTVSAEAKADRRQSMYADYGFYNVEVREPKTRPKRFSTLLF